MMKALVAALLLVAAFVPSFANASESCPTDTWVIFTYEKPACSDSNEKSLHAAMNLIGQRKDFVVVDSFRDGPTHGYVMISYDQSEGDEGVVNTSESPDSFIEALRQIQGIEAYCYSLNPDVPFPL